MSEQDPHILGILLLLCRISGCGEGRLSVPGDGHTRKSVNYKSLKRQENQGLSRDDTPGKTGQSPKNRDLPEKMDTPGRVFHMKG